MRSLRGTVFATGLLVLLGTAAVSLAQVHGTTTVSFQIAKNQTAGRVESFTYGVKSFPSGATLVLQRQKRDGSWLRLKTLKRHSGTGSVPAQAIGLYVLRVAVLKGGHVRAEKRRTIYVYGKVLLTQICNSSNVEWGNNDGGCNSTTQQVGPYLFQSAATFDAPGSSSENAPAVNVTITPSTSCRTLHLDYGESNADQQHAGGSMMITQTLLQSNTEPATSTFAGGVLQHSDFKLDGGPIQITDESTYTGPGMLRVLENGYLNCYTANGAVPGGSR